MIFDLLLTAGAVVSAIVVLPFKLLTFSLELIPLFEESVTLLAATLDFITPLSPRVFSALFGAFSVYLTFMFFWYSYKILLIIIGKVPFFGGHYDPHKLKDTNISR